MSEKQALKALRDEFITIPGEPNLKVLSIKYDVPLGIARANAADENWELLRNEYQSNLLDTVAEELSIQSTNDGTDFASTVQTLIQGQLNHMSKLGPIIERRIIEMAEDPDLPESLVLKLYSLHQANSQQTTKLLTEIAKFMKLMQSGDKDTEGAEAKLEKLLEEMDKLGQLNDKIVSSKGMREVRLTGSRADELLDQLEH